jgi:hypothetical protein
MSAPIDCPICLCVVNSNVDCSTTNCGHCFHTSCLTQNIARNGFNCPCCRNDVSGKPEEFIDIIVKRITFQNRRFLMDKANFDVYSYEAYKRHGNMILIGRWIEDRQTIAFVY